jgi:hypothetical protein
MKSPAFAAFRNGMRSDGNGAVAQNPGETAGGGTNAKIGHRVQKLYEF